MLAGVEFMTSGCPNGTRLITVDGFVMRTNCDSWSCPICRKRLAMKWALDIRYAWALWKPRPFYFITLTMPGWMTDPAEGYKDLPRCWKNFSQQTIRQYGWFSYAAFAEEQKENRDMVHLHIITRTNLPSRLNEYALHAGFGFQARNLLASGMNCAYYVAKYASKSLPHAPRKFRRVRISRDWPRLPEPILPSDYIPMEPKESIRQYLHRCAEYFGFSPLEMLERWENEALDIGQT